MKYSTCVSSTARELTRGSLQRQRLESRRVACSPFATWTVLPELASVIGGRTVEDALTAVTQPNASAMRKEFVASLSVLPHSPDIGNARAVTPARRS